MKSINSYINEALIKKDTKLNKDTYKKPDDPNTWTVGDTLYGVYHYSMTLPYFYKVIKKTAKTFTLVELTAKLASGHYNGYFSEVPDDSKLEKDLKGEQIRARINKFNELSVGRSSSKINLHLWDGKPVEGCDLD
jgi:hypothetical protein